MTFPEIWAQLKRKQPLLENDDAIVEFTTGNLRKLLGQLYKQGQASIPKRPEPDDPSHDMFADIFRRRDR